MQTIMQPLQGVKVLEFAGIGPGPFAAMLLADMGAEVVRIQRPGQPPGPQRFLNRHRVDISLDLRTDAGRTRAIELIRTSDILIEGFRPGKMEALGLGPTEAKHINPGLVYGRMTGWGRTGPLSALAGHDLNYLALTGLLSLIGTPDAPPPPPLNLISDFGGGGMYLAFGVLAALWQAKMTRKGAVVDAAMIHGTSHLATFIHSMKAAGRWSEPRGGNLLDGGSPNYRVYMTNDNQYMAVAALEPEFFNNLLQALGLRQQFGNAQHDRSRWPELTTALEEAFKARSQAEWTAMFTHLDACVSPVLTLEEAMMHPQMQDSFYDRNGVMEPTPAPRILPL